MTTVTTGGQVSMSSVETETLCRHPDSEGGLTQPPVERPERLSHDSRRSKKVNVDPTDAPSIQPLSLHETE